MTTRPLRRLVAATDIPIAGRHFSLAADASERARLAEALGIVAIDRLVGEFDLKPRAGGAVAVVGEVQAEVVQACVVTLDPVGQSVREELELLLVPAEGVHAGGGATVENGIAADTFENGRIDLGAIAAEHLALGLDPYPRKPGVEFEGHTESEGEGERSPFAGLAALKREED
jgi:uncharacterized metal-binding protein YceD (DUF177 family)